MTGHFEKAGVTPRRHLVEIRTADAGEYALGQEVTVELFEAGAGRRRHRHHQGQGHRRCHEASRLPRRRRLARCAPQPPQARLDRRLRRRRAACSRACGWPAGWASSARPPRTSRVHARRHRAGPAARQGRRSRPQGRRRPGRALPACEGGVTMTDTLTVDVVDPEGKTAGTVELPAEIFDVQTNVPLIHQVVVAQLRGGPPGHALHEDPRRGPRRWHASRTGRRAPAAPVRARPARRSSPAVASSTARTPRDYTQRTPKKMKAAALRGALSDRGPRTAACTSLELARRGRRAVDQVRASPRSTAWSRGARPARRARARRRGHAGRACATSTGSTCWSPTSSTPTTC